MKEGCKMKKAKKLFAAIAVATVLLTSVGGMTANAANGSLKVGSGYATLTNKTNMKRYGIVNVSAINRSTLRTAKTGHNEGVLLAYGSVTASVTGYSSTTYYFKGSGTLYNGTSIYSGVFLSTSGQY